MADLTGQTLGGRYQLIERLGRGGMADVYRGFQPALERDVAVKVLHPHLSEDPDFIERFDREAKNVAKLRHPHIVQVFDAGSQGEHYYMVMEYIEGGHTLKELLQDLAARDQRLPLEHSLDIIAKLADALDYAQSQGMIHRDVKPANVLLSTIDRPVLSDFGIARLAGQTGLTRSGAMIGTPAYMSPEQGRGERADERSDIYALGIVLYEMLTGQPPYDADTPYGVILKHIKDPLVPPHELREDLPVVVEHIVFKSLAKDPDHRYQTAGEMRDALQAAVFDLEQQTEAGVVTPPGGVVVAEVAEAAETQPAPVADDGSTLAVAPAEAETALRKKRGRWWVWAIVGVIALALLGGALLVGLPLLFPEERGGVAAEIFEEPGGEQTEVLSPPDSEGRESEAEPLAEKAVQKLWEDNLPLADELFSEALGIDPENVTALAGQAILFMMQEQWQPARENIDHALELAPDDPLALYAQGALHRWAPEFYNPDVALDVFSRVTEQCDYDRILCALAHNERAQVLFWDFEDFEGAMTDMEQAIDLDPHNFNFYDTRAYFREYLHDFEGALQDFERAYELSGWQGYLESAAAMAVRMEDFPRALGFYDDLLQEFPDDPHLFAGQGYVAWRAGHVDRARRSVDRALEIDPGLLEAHYLVGLMLLDERNPEEAMANFLPVSEELERWMYEHPFLNPGFGHEIFYDMARAEWMMDQPEEALRLLERSIEQDYWWPDPFILRGQIFADLDDLDMALESYTRALEMTDNPEMQAHIEEMIEELDR
jgi:tetratricopeptide (TPR) repeat protein